MEVTICAAIEVLADQDVHFKAVPLITLYIII